MSEGSGMGFWGRYWVGGISWLVVVLLGVGLFQGALSPLQEIGIILVGIAAYFPIVEAAQDHNGGAA